MAEAELIVDETSRRIIEIAKSLATEYGAHTVTVRSILAQLGTTNRVFYNRFHNIDEVLQIIYTEAVEQMHESLESDIDINEDFFGYVMDIAVKVLVNTYDIKMQFSQYMFEHDSLTESNRRWWEGAIKKFLAVGVSKKLVKPVDPDILSYSIWCFCRGFNADAVKRRLPIEDAIETFRFGFGCFLEGVKER